MNVSQVQIDCDFPGGNVIVDGWDGDIVRIRPDLRDTDRHWFYWHFRVRGGAGRRLRFQFMVPRRCVTEAGPCMSVDGGETWHWLGAVERDGEGREHFEYAFAEDADEVYFGLAPPYTEHYLRRWLDQHGGHPALAVETLCQSEAGRPIEKLRLGRLDGDAPCRVAMLCRQHACESLASYVLEGAMSAVLADDAIGEAWRQQVELWVVPFMDKDGVEAGDQGKGRAPHDHNRDWADESIYASVRSVREQLPAWAQGRLRMTLDLHCPGVYGPVHSKLHQVGSDDPERWRRQQAFAAILSEANRDNELPYCPDDDLPFGVDWNKRDDGGSGMSRSFTRWAPELPGVHLATSLEIPYARVHDQWMTSDKARAFGRALADTIVRQAGERGWTAAE